MLFNLVVCCFMTLLCVSLPFDSTPSETDYYGQADDIIASRNSSSAASVDYSFGDEDIIPSATNLQIPVVDSKWPNATVPFLFHPMMTAADITNVLKAMEEYHRHSCVRFKPWQGEADYLVIGYPNRSECGSLVGRQGGRQPLHLSPRCARSVGVTMHELMHALGFFHEHMRPDRDNYVYINYSNIDQELWKNFAPVRSVVLFGDLGAGYDFRSLMHYRVYAMTNNSLPTIVPRVDPGTTCIGQRKGFSDKDIIKLNNFYGCPLLSSYFENFHLEANSSKTNPQPEHYMKIKCDSSSCSSSTSNYYLLCFKIIYLLITHKHLFDYIYFKCFRIKVYYLLGNIVYAYNTTQDVF